MPERIQRRRIKGWQMPENTVYVGRGSRWGNPFRIYREHTLTGPSWRDARDNWGRVTAASATVAYVTSSRDITAAELVDHFDSLIFVRKRDEPERFAAWIEKLKGKNLACWCPLDQPCHADVLLELANGARA